MMATLLPISSCGDDDTYDRLTFIGDSLVARWDLQASFPNTVTRNLGVSGSGLQYLRSLKGSMTGRDIVVLSGTNDIVTILSGSTTVSSYAEDYLEAIGECGAAHTYLYCILPRGERAGGRELNPVITELNATVRSLISGRGDITYIDVYDSLCRDGVLNMNYSLDGLHLNIYGYEILTANF